MGILKTVGGISSMKTIETTATVLPEGKMILFVPPDIHPGPHKIVVVIEESRGNLKKRLPLDFPTHDVGPWPEGFSLRREALYGDDGR